MLKHLTQLVYKCLCLAALLALPSCGVGLCASDDGCFDSVIDTRFRFNLTLGQPDLSVDQWTTRVASYGGITMASYQGKFFRTETSGHVKIFNSVPTTGDTVADVVLGIPNPKGYSGEKLAGEYESPTGKIVSERRIGGWPGPHGVGVQSGRLYACDSSNHRVLIWNSIPTQDFAPADLVLGQPDFLSSTANIAGITASTMSSPYGIVFDGNKVLVLDNGNNRILVWNSPPTSNYQPADVVIGQANMTSTGTSVFSTPAQMTMVGTSLWVANSYKSRVSIWNSVPAVDGTPPDTEHVLTIPTGIASDGTRLMVAQHRDNGARILVFDTIPVVNLSSPDRVLGQPDGVTTAYRGETSRDFAPGYLAIIDNKIFSDASISYRLLVWNTVTPTTYQPSDFTIGSSNNQPYDPWGNSQNFRTLHVAASGDKVAIPDYYDGRRVMIWNSRPLQNHQAADLAVGKTNLDPPPACFYLVPSCLTASSSNFDRSEGVGFLNGGLLVSDTSNHRALIWNSVPTANGAAADTVLGQPTTTSVAVNNGSRSAQTLDDPVGSVWTGGKLFIADRSSHRVLVWDSWPTVLRQAADWVMGQSTFAAGSANGGGTVSSLTFNQPTHLASNGQNLAIADTANHRVLIWNSVPTTNGQAPDVILGQTNGVSNSANAGGSAPTASTLSSPYGIAFQQGRLLVADSGNNRLLVWNAVPTANNAAADRVFGQTDFSSYRCNPISDTSLCAPRGVAVDGQGDILVTDNMVRVVRFTIPQ